MIATKRSIAVEREYASLASSYDSRWGEYLSSTHNVALKFLNLKAGDRVLDASAGTGVLAAKISIKVKTAGKVALVDISKEMLDQARNKLQSTPNVVIKKANVNSLPFKSAEFSKVVSVSAFHHYASPMVALKEFFRVLDEDGELIIIDWCRNPFKFRIYDVYKRFTAKSHVKSYTTFELKRLCHRASFIVVDVFTWNSGSWSLMGIKAKKKRRE